MKSTALVTATRRALRALGDVRGETILVGLSGGADSVALLDALALLSHEAGFTLAAAHLDHGLRPESGEDAAFCAALCEKRGIPLRVGQAAVRERARLEGGGIEDAARRERHAFLRAVEAEVGAFLIALAHTRDDQAETFFLRLLRGSGRAGLRSMRTRAGDLWRPLLGVGRHEVLAHLRQRGLAWREDPTNEDLGFLRNRVRHELIPYIEAHFNPRILSTLGTTAAQLGEESQWLERQAEALFAEVARREPPRIVLSRPGLRAAPRPLARLAVRRALRETGGLAGVGFVHVEKILDVAFSRAPSGRRLALPGKREAVVSFDDIRIGPRSESVSPYAYPLPVPGRIELPGGLTVTATPAAGPETCEAETAVIEMPEQGLVVRTRRPGDRLRAGRREVSLKRALQERRVPVDLRPGLPLVASGSRVLWFPGPPPFPAIRGTLEVADAVVSLPARGHPDVAPGPGKSENEPRFVRVSIERS